MPSRTPVATLALLALLPGCFTRSLWRTDHRDEILWETTLRTGPMSADECGGTVSMPVAWPASEHPIAAALGLPSAATAARIEPVTFAASAAAFQAHDPWTGEQWSPWLLTSIEGSPTLELSCQVPARRDDDALRHLPGSRPTTYCWTCGAGGFVFEDTARASIAAAGPAEARECLLLHVRRTPISTTEKVLKTPFTALADALLLPFELLTIGRWWDEQ